jgi:predicted neuraminidase
MSACGLGDEGAEALAALLARVPMLTALAAGYDSIGPKGACAQAYGLVRTPLLSSLDVRYNLMQADAAMLAL